MSNSVVAKSELGLVPYWRLSGFYFFYFASLGALVPFWSLYLQAEGYGSREIGWLSAVILATRIAAPNLWGWLGDYSGQRLRIIRWGAGLAAIFFSGVLFSDYAKGWQFECLLISVLLYSFFWNAILAQFEVLTLHHLDDKPQLYGAVRLWGSVGFIVVVAAIGILFDFVSVSYLPWILFFLLLLMWLNSLFLTEVKKSCRLSHWRGFLAIATKKPVLYFLASAFLLQLSFGPYYTFFSVFLERLNYSKTAIGLLWSLGVVAEIAIFMCMYKLLPVLGVRLLLLLSCAMASFRWLLLAYCAEYSWVLIFSQCLHAFSFGTAHAASIEFIRRYFSSQQTSIDHQGQGQSLYSSISWGCGGALGAVLSGYLWSAGNEATFVYAALASTLAFVFVWLSVHKQDALLS